MSKHDLMRNPAYSPILYAIEKRLAELDTEAAAQGMTLTDSNARSILVRAANMSRGKPPAGKGGPGANPKEQFLARAVSEIIKAKDTIAEKHDLPDGTVERRPLRANIWLDTLECLKESCEIRTGPTPGSRDYLDYIQSFLI